MHRRICVASPIAKIPPEVLQEVFHFMFPYPTSFPSDDFPQRLRLGQVCREWQYLSLAQVSLWNDITIEFRVRQMKNLHTLERIKACLRLSKGAPIYIRISHPLEILSDGGEHIISDLLSPFLKQIVDLELRTTFPVLQSLLLLPAGSFSALHRLTIRVGRGPLVRLPTPDGFHAFHGALHLRSVDITRPACSLYNLSIPLPQIHDINLESETATSMQSIINDLKSCTNLRSCSLTISSDPGDATLLTAGYAHLPCLKRLELHSTTFQAEDKTAVPLVTPSLEELTITSTRWPPDVIASFIRHSKCNILRLALHHVADDFFDDFMDYVPSLEVLDLGMMTLESSILEKMSSARTLPMLRSLKCTARKVSIFRELLDMLVSRTQRQNIYSPHGVMDVKVVLYFNEPKGSRVLEWLEERGVHIQMNQIFNTGSMGGQYYKELDFVPLPCEH